MSQEFLGQIQITDTTKDFTVDGLAATLTTGIYYIEGYTGESTIQLKEHLQATIRALHADYDAGGAKECSVTRSSSTGLLTISFASGPVVISWTDGDLGALLGYTADLTGDSAYVATNTPKAVWRPTRGITEYPSDLTLWWGKRSSSKITISKDGTSYGMEGNILYGGNYRYENLTEAECIESASYTWSCLESFWEVVVHECRPIRVLPDRSSYTATTDFHEGYMLPAGADSDGSPVTIGSFRELTAPTLDSYRGFWDFEFSMAKYVVAS